MRSTIGPDEKRYVGQKQTPRTVLSGQRIPAALACPAFAHIEASQLDSWFATHDSHPLAVISFGKAASNAVDCPSVSLHLPQLIGPAQVEVWTSTQPVYTFRKDQFSAAMNDEVAAAFLTVEEEGGTPLEDTTYAAYHRLLGELRELGYPHLWRAWNYCPRINERDNGLERYQRFCIGRHQAFAEVLPDFPNSLPAGTAVGTVSGPLHIMILAGIRQATHLGNPRQVNAYEYPQTYGPRSPSFARATIGRLDGNAHLFVAGTASIVGHTSRHPGFPEEQTRETAENLRVLLNHANSMTGVDFIGSHTSTCYKVYVRDPDHLHVIHRTLQDTSLFLDRVLFLEGDPCRPELLVEIEGLIISD